MLPLLALLYYFVPMREAGKEVTLIIENGKSVRFLAKELKAKKVIPHEKLFLLWLRLNKLERKIQAGKVILCEYDGIIETAIKLQNAKAIELSVTVSEGLTIWQTASRIAEIFPIDTLVFISLCSNEEFIKKLGFEISSLEGFLFPETYRFRPQAKSEEIIKGMVKEFRRIYSSLKQTKFSSTFSQLEIITMASIVEKEAMIPSERTRISGVFHNRVRLKIPLGADPTVRYSIRKFSGPLRVSELKNRSPYNTRIFTGLPPGPICSPGMGAIEAAIEPLDTKDLFFVAKWDGSGEHDFSETNAQHDRKKMKIRRKNSLRKRKKLKGK